MKMMMMRVSRFEAIKEKVIVLNNIKSQHLKAEMIGVTNKLNQHHDLMKLLII